MRLSVSIDKVYNESEFNKVTICPHFTILISYEQKAH